MKSRGLEHEPAPKPQYIPLRDAFVHEKFAILGLLCQQGPAQKSSENADHYHILVLDNNLGQFCSCTRQMPKSIFFKKFENLQSEV